MGNDRRRLQGRLRTRGRHGDTPRLETRAWRGGVDDRARLRVRRRGPRRAGAARTRARGPGQPGQPWRARVLGRLADTLAVDGGQPERREALSREGVEVARRLNDSLTVIAALNSRAETLAGPE